MRMDASGKDSSRSQVQYRRQKMAEDSPTDRVEYLLRKYKVARLYISCKIIIACVLLKFAPSPLYCT